MRFVLSMSLCVIALPACRTAEDSRSGVKESLSEQPGATAAPDKIVYEIELVYQAFPERPFLIQVAAANKKAIEALDFYAQDSAPGSQPKIGIPVGVIHVTPQTQRSKWGFAFDPKTV